MKKILFISPVNPFSENMGHKLAIASDLRMAIESKMEVSLIYFSFDDSKPWVSIKERSYPVKPKSGSKPVRLIRSIFSCLPAAVERYNTKRFNEIISNCLCDIKPHVVVVEDCSLAFIIRSVINSKCGPSVVTRSHNCMADVCAAQVRTSSIFLKPLWYLELKKWKKLEKLSCALSDNVWAISSRDKSLLETNYGPCSIHTLSISLPMSRYLGVPVEAGSPFCITHIGTLDSKKSIGMENFLKTVWPLLLKKNNKLRLEIAGRVTSSLSLNYPNVHYLGEVEDDVSFISRGRFALNCQTVGGGIKLKSIVAMAAGRTLISTDVGVEGLPLTDGCEFIKFNVGAQVGKDIWDLSCESQNLKIAEAGRKYAMFNHSVEAVLPSFRELIDAI